MADRIGKKRGQYPAKAGSAGFAMRSIERKKALQEGYPTADRELPRTAADMGRAVGFSGDDADLAKPFLAGKKFAQRLQTEAERAAEQNKAAGAADAVQMMETAKAKKALGVTRGTKNTYE